MPSGPSPDGQHLPRRRPKWAFEVAAEGVLDLEAGMEEEELHLAREIHVAVEVADVAIDGVAARETVVEKSHLGTLLVRQ